MKKIIAVLLSVLIIFSSMAIVASAATQDDAAAAAEAFNAAKVDYSGVYWKNTPDAVVNFQMKKINSLLAQIVAEKNLKGTFYSDETVTVISAKLAGVTNTKFDSIDFPGVKAQFPEAYEYITKAKEEKKTWETLGTVPFGVKDRDSFVKALGAFSANFGGVISLACAMSPDLYSGAIIPLVESLHVGKMLSFGEYAAASGFDGGKTMEILAGYVADAVEAFAKNPLYYITDVLPDFAASYDVFAKTVEANPMAAAFGLKMPGLDTLVKGLAANLNGLKLPEIDFDKLAGMATARAVESGSEGGYDVELNGDRAVVFGAILDYLKRVLEDDNNQMIIYNYLSKVLGITDTDYRDLIAAIKASDIIGIVAALSSILDTLLSKAFPLPPFVDGKVAEILKTVLKVARFLKEFISRIPMPLAK